MSSSCNDIEQCRTRFSVVLSCLVTLFACTWVSLHPNIPDPQHRSLSRFFRRLKLMALAIIAPEVIVVWALRQRMVARQLSNEHSMTLVHGFFVSMGGYVTARGHILHPVTPHAIGKSVSPIHILDISDEEILDRSKGDTFSKGIAVLQTTWFITQCIARRIQHLPLTELEVITLAFAFLNIVIHIIWWNKPLDVRFPVRIGPSPEHPIGLGIFDEKPAIQTRTLRKKIRDAYMSVLNAPIEMFGGEMEEENIESTAISVPALWAGRLDGRSRAWAATISIFLAMGFGAVHCVGWNGAFLSETEKILWRIASASVVAVPFVFFLDAVFLATVAAPEWWHGVTWWLALPFGIFTYVIARGILIALPLVSLRSLPADAYKDVEWSNFMPHIR